MQCMILRLACQVQRHGNHRNRATEELGGPECPIGEVAGGGHARHRSIEGGDPGKVLSPQAKHEALAAMVEKIKLSERRTFTYHPELNSYSGGDNRGDRAGRFQQ
jgi:hypothetical protein